MRNPEDQERDFIAEAKARGAAAVAAVCRITEANELEAETIRKFESTTRHGGRADLIVRRDGVDHVFQADWLIRLFRRFPNNDSVSG